MEFSRQECWSGLPFPSPWGGPRDWCYSGLAMESYFGSPSPVEAKRIPYLKTHPGFLLFFFLGSLHSHVPKDSPLIQGLGAQVSGSQDPAPINILFLKEQILSRTPWMVPVAFEVFFIFDFFFF